jgi:fumarylacetoacetase
MAGLDATHDPHRRSWVEPANAAGADFPIQNLPYGVFSVDGGPRRVGVAIGDAILDLTLLEAVGLVRPGGDAPVFDQGVLNPFMALPRTAWSAMRAAVADLLDAGDAGDPRLRDDADLRGRALAPQAGAALHLPIFVRSYTDFYASRHHAENVGAMFRGRENALPPNWLHIPVGYNGRASTVVVSGTPVRRPLGQLKDPNDATPRFGPSARLDIELELGAIVGQPSEMGRPVTTAEAAGMLFGYVLLNDWSARDIQVWEYQPLGPFQSKAFATSISPWVVTAEALAPFRVAACEPERPLLAYLREPGPGLYDITLEATLAPAGGAATTISRTSYLHMYYSFAQQLAHHAVGGCAMCTGDLLGSGTVSGPSPDSLGSLLEITCNGRDPVAVDGGRRNFLEDGDTVAIRGWCDAPGRRIGFGSVAATVLPAPAIPDGWR